MKDKLEQFIQNNREDFDREQPSLKVWAGISKGLQQEATPSSLPERPATRVSMWRYVSQAAAVLLLIGAGTLIGLQLANSEAERQTLGDISTEYGELEDYYESEVKEKTALLARYNQDPTVTEDLEQLGDFFEELQSELKEAPPGTEEQIINAMINNYQSRLELLERVLSRIQSNQPNSKNTNNEEEVTI